MIKVRNEETGEIRQYTGVWVSGKGTHNVVSVVAGQSHNAYDDRIMEFDRIYMNGQYDRCKIQAPWKLVT